MKIIELEEVDSTNEYIRRMNFLKEVTVVAKKQTGGKGTKGRSFVSDEGGLYLSVLRIFKNFNSENTFKIMVNACVAVCKTLEGFSLKPNIRWANDVFANGKKISGTLIENSFSGNTVRSVIGIGINVNNKIPEELKDTATSVSLNSSRKISVDEVKRKLVKNLSKEYSVAEYKSYISFFGKEILLITAEGERVVTALDVADDGRLIVREKSGSISCISAAEVSLKS